MADGSIILKTLLDTAGIEKGLGGLNGVAKKGAKLAIAGVAGIGTALGATTVKAVKFTDEYTKAMNGFEASTGEANAKVNGFGEAMQNVYKHNFGENFEDIGNAMSSIKQNLDGIDASNIEKVTESAIAMRDTFDIDINEGLLGVNSMMKQFGMTAEESYNLMAQGAQNGLNQNGDLADQLAEYSVYYSDLGISAEEMFNMMANGAENGVYQLDYLNDAVKEFGIRTKDGSAGTKQAFADLGLNADELTAKFAKGGKDAKEAFMEVTTALGNVEDDVKRNQLGVQLFGTKWEDLGEDAVKALTDMDGKISGSVDALDKINEIKYNSFGEAIEGIKRQLEVGVLLPLGEAVLPLLNEFANWFAKEGVPQIEKFSASIKDKIPAIATTFKVAFKVLSVLLTAFVRNINIIIPALGLLGGAFAVFKAVDKVQKMVETFKQFKAITQAVSVAQKALALVMSMNPFTIALVAIGLLVAGLVHLWNTNEGFRNAVITAWNNIKEVAMTVFGGICKFFTEIIPNAFTSFVGFLGSAFSGLADIAGNIMAGLRDGFVNGWNSIVAFFTETIPTLIGSIVGWFAELPGKIWEGLSAVVTKIGEWGTNLKNKAVEVGTNFVNTIVKFFTELPGKIWNGLVIVVTKISEWGTTIKNKAVEIGTNFLNNIVKFFSQLPAKIWNCLKQVVTKIASWGSSLASSAKKSATSLVNAFINTVKTLPGKFISIGKNIVTGLWKGISGNIKWLTGKVGGFANSILKKAKSVLGIHSPSRVFRDIIGANIVKGVGVGIDVETPSLEKDMDNNLSSLANRLKATVDLESTKATQSIAVATNYTAEKETQKKNNNVNEDTNSILGGFNLNIENFNNNREQDMDDLMRKASLYLKRHGILV
ncbi:TPA: phage tail tape measure protein [Clostridioides difficile]